MLQQDNDGLCVAAGQNPRNPFADLDPDLDCRKRNSFRVLRPCKSNCKGGIIKQKTFGPIVYCAMSVNFAVVSGGSALVAASLAAGTGTLTPTLGLLFGRLNRFFKKQAQQRFL